LALQASNVSRAAGFVLVDPTTVSFNCEDALDANLKFSEVIRGRDRAFGPIP